MLVEADVAKPCDENSVDRTVPGGERCASAESGDAATSGDWESCCSSKHCRLARRVVGSARVTPNGTDFQLVQGVHDTARTQLGRGETPDRVANVLRMPSLHLMNRGAHAETLRRSQGAALESAIGSHRWEDANFRSHRPLRLIWHRGQPRGDGGGNPPYRPPPWEPRRGAA